VHLNTKHAPCMFAALHAVKMGCCCCCCCCCSQPGQYMPPGWTLPGCAWTAYAALPGLYIKSACQLRITLTSLSGQSHPSPLEATMYPQAYIPLPACNPCQASALWLTPASANETFLFFAWPLCCYAQCLITAGAFKLCAIQARP